VDNRLFAGVFSRTDLELLEAFTNQAAIAIDNARLFARTDQQLARRVEELTLFQEIDRELNRSLDLDRVLGLALDWAVQLTNARGGSVGLFRDEVDVEGKVWGQVLGVRAYLGESQAKEGKVDTSLSALHPIVAQILAEKQPVHTKHATDEQAIDGTATAAQLVVPILREGIVSGLIALESSEVNAFTSDDIAFVMRLADRAAVAIENARLYQVIAAANKAKSDFISVVTHELRLPMTSIKGYTDLVRKEMVGPLTDQQKNFLDVVRRNIDRMSVLISDLSDINRVESGRMKFELGEFDLKEVIGDVVGSLEEVIAGKNQKITLQIPEKIPEIYADKNRVSQILTNLVSNAHKYSEAGDSIWVSVGLDKGFVKVGVLDNGLGISPENQAKLFTQFFRAEDEKVREQTGWGLGLSIVKMMVEAQGGEIGFESVYREGSLFWFTLPY
jgi:signal transduction histidine kinase